MPSRGEDGAAGTPLIPFTHPRCDWIYCQHEEDKQITSACQSIGKSEISRRKGNLGEVGLFFLNLFLKCFSSAHKALELTQINLIPHGHAEVMELLSLCAWERGWR